VATKKFRGDYDQLNQIAQTFARQADSSKQMRQNIQEAANLLENGHWVGKAADKFYQELNSAVLPSLNRLARALQTASRTTRQINQIIQQAENDAALLFRSSDTGSAAAATSSTGARLPGPGGPEAQPVSALFGSTSPAFGPGNAKGGSGKRPLEQTIRDMFGSQSPADPTPLLTAIQNATPAEREAVLNNPKLMEMLTFGLGATGNGVAYFAALLEGRLAWVGPSGPDPNDGYRIKTIPDILSDTDDFAVWIRDGQEHQNQPDLSTGSMNCWEFALLAAYKAGQVSYDQLVNLHSQAAAAGQKADEEWLLPGQAEHHGREAYKQVFKDALGATNAQAWSPGTVPPAGSMVFFDKGKAGPLAHVAISLGTTDKDGRVEVMSLWTVPGPAARRTTIEDLMAGGGFQPTKVTYGKLNIK
jgi:WXG100 family type VII secretion target